ncbi:unnamed protein product [Adineta steineri]|uniref:EF-hand domain-containing protein n=1 Tax=Adineta steineri TaxID=433720 RepID=A0A814DZ80_9BILA|nr:unnamed protein product [Adineta steineri]
MNNIFVKYWKTFAIASASLTSSYFYSQYDKSPRKDRILSALTVQAAEHERRNLGKTLAKYRHLPHKKDLDDDDDDEEEDDDDNSNNDELDRSDEKVKNIREKRFRDFSSLEYNGEIYMTPLDFLESIITDRPRPRIGRRQLTEEMVDSILYNTTPKHRGSKRFFRNLEGDEPPSQFELAFHMFDTGGDLLIDKNEFLVLEKVMSNKRSTKHQTTKHSASKSNRTFKIDKYYNYEYNDQSDTTLLIHFFGKNGRDTLNYTEFKRFMENFQMEILEIEFTEFSHGFKTISGVDFASMLLRYTNFDHDMKKLILRRVKKSHVEPNVITFEEFKHFFTFLNNLDEFNIAMRFHQLSNKPISQAEFQRAAKISTGFELESHIIALLFLIFDADGDQHLGYDEFMAVMKDRISRGFQKNDHSEISNSKFQQFKHCLREHAKYDAAAT